MNTKVTLWSAPKTAYSPSNCVLSVPVCQCIHFYAHFFFSISPSVLNLTDSAPHAYTSTVSFSRQISPINGRLLCPSHSPYPPSLFSGNHVSRFLITWQKERIPAQRPALCPRLWLLRLVLVYDDNENGKSHCESTDHSDSWPAPCLVHLLTHL